MTFHLHIPHIRALWRHSDPIVQCFLPWINPSLVSAVSVDTSPHLSLSYYKRERERVGIAWRDCLKTHCHDQAVLICWLCWTGPNAIYLSDSNGYLYLWNQERWIRVTWEKAKEMLVVKRQILQISSVSNIQYKCNLSNKQFNAMSFWLLKLSSHLPPWSPLSLAIQAEAQQVIYDKWTIFSFMH